MGRAWGTPAENITWLLGNTRGICKKAADICGVEMSGDCRKAITTLYLDTTSQASQWVSKSLLRILISEFQRGLAPSIPYADGTMLHDRWSSFMNYNVLDERVNYSPFSSRGSDR